MVIHIFRAMFILIMVAVGYQGIKTLEQEPIVLPTLLVVGVLLVCIDILSPRRKLAVFSGVFLGLLVGLLVTYALSFVVKLVVDIVTGGNVSDRDPTVQFINLINGAVFSYLAISFILQTKDDFRFIIPYVEFRRQSKGSRPIVLDTSALIDGRIADIAATSLLDTQLLVPRFVLQELQAIADSHDHLKRNRGRRGLDVLAKLQANKSLDVLLYEVSGHRDDAVDQRLVHLTKELSGRLLTTDFNLIKVAELGGVEVINLNDVAAALRPSALPGERLTVRLVRPGEEPNQGVGFLDDGTMVVVDHARAHVGEDVEFTITNTRQTSAGRMIFGRLADTGGADVPTARRGRGRAEASPTPSE